MDSSTNTSGSIREFSLLSAPRSSNIRVNSPTRRLRQSATALKELEFDGKIPSSSGTGESEDVVHSVASMTQGLENGTDAQKSLILFEVQQVISHAKEHALKTLIPVMLHNVPSWSPDLQIAVADTLLCIVSDKLPTHDAKEMVRTGFEVLMEQDRPELFRAWGEVLAALLPHIKWPPQEIEQLMNRLDAHVLPDKKGYQLMRRLTARVIGPIALLSEREYVRTKLLSRALSLISEDDTDIRGMVVESIAFIGTVVDIESLEQRIWPSLLPLIKDPDARLHAATLRTIARIAAAHRKTNPTAPFFTSLLPPVLIRECQYLRKAAAADQRLVNVEEYLLLEINSEIFGELLFSGHKSLEDDAPRKEAFKAFTAMATCNGPIVRRWCAYNFPGVCLSLAKRCRTELSSLLEFLARDGDPETRWNLAAGIHESAKILVAADTLDGIFKAVSCLLHDESPLVRMNVLQNLDTLLGTLTSFNPYKAMRKLETVFQNLQLLSEGNWRTQELLAKQMRQVAPLVPPPSIRDNVLPLLYQLTDECCYTVRKASMAAVAVCLRYLPDTMERNEVMETFRLEWARGPIFWMRIAFVDCAQVAVATYSRVLFRDTFALELLRLAHDPVPNVRMRAAQLMHEIAPACHQMDEFHTALSALREDSDIDVMRILEGIDDRIQRELDAGKKSFEQDMSREAEEQDLYTKHLQLKAEVNKKRGGVKHKTNALLSRTKGRATVALPSLVSSSPPNSGDSPHSPRPSKGSQPVQGPPRAQTALRGTNSLAGGIRQGRNGQGVAGDAPGPKPVPNTMESRWSAEDLSKPANKRQAKAEPRSARRSMPGYIDSPTGHSKSSNSPRGTTSPTSAMSLAVTGERGGMAGNDNSSALTSPPKGARKDDHDSESIHHRSLRNLRNLMSPKAGSAASPRSGLVSRPSLSVVRKRGEAAFRS